MYFVLTVTVKLVQETNSTVIISLLDTHTHTHTHTHTFSTLHLWPKGNKGRAERERTYVPLSFFSSRVISFQCKC